MLEQQSKMLSKDSSGFHIELFRNEDRIVAALRRAGLVQPEFREKKIVVESVLADVSYDLDVLEAEVQVKAHQRKDPKTGKVEDVDAHTREAPNVYLTNDDVEQRSSWGEKYWVLKKNSQILPGNGGPLSKEDLPEEMYHITVNKDLVDKSGFLRGQSDGGGMGGGNSLSGVSLTTDKGSAALMVRELRRTVYLSQASIKSTEDFQSIMNKFVAQDLRIGGGKVEVKEALQAASNSAVRFFDGNASSYPDKARLASEGYRTSYLMARSIRTDDLLSGRLKSPLRNPLLMGDNDDYRKINLKQIGFVTVKRSAVPSKALIHKGSDDFLHEIRIHSDVPIHKVHGVKKKLSEVQVRVKAYARVRKGRQQFVNTHTRENKAAKNMKIVGASSMEEATIRKILERHDPKVLQNIPTIGVFGGNNFVKTWSKINNGDAKGAKSVAGFYSEIGGEIVINRDYVRTFGWRAVLDHEIGHSAYYHSKNTPNWIANTMSDKSFDRFTRYSREGTHEAFAESYMAYMSAGGKAKKAKFGRVFKSIDDVVKGVHKKNYWKDYEKFIKPSLELEDS